jgi:hypothetical protein
MSTATETATPATRELTDLALSVDCGDDEPRGVVRASPSTPSAQQLTQTRHRVALHSRLAFDRSLELAWASTSVGFREHEERYKARLVAVGDELD